MKTSTHPTKETIAEQILDYWHTLEFLGQDALPSLTYEERRKNAEAVKRVQAGGAPGKEAPKVLRLITPVERGCDLLGVVRREAERHGMGCWGNITVYAGRNRRERWIREIARALDEEDARPEESQEEIAWFGLELSPQGAYIERTFSLSPIIWALNHIEAQAGKTQAGKAQAGSAQAGRAQAGKALASCLSEQSYREDVDAFEQYFKKIGEEEQLEKMARMEEGAESLSSESTAESDFPDLQDADTAAPLKIPSDDSNPFSPITFEHIDHVYREVQETYIKPVLGHGGETGDGSADEAQGEKFYCILLCQVYKDEETREKYGEEDYLGLGRAFFADDLQLVLSKLQMEKADGKSDVPEPLIRYIAGAYADYYPESGVLPREERVDLEHAGPDDEAGDMLREQLAGILDVRNAPIGKWPSKFMPALMQQAAVNLAVAEDERTGAVFSVNGPPGTGKTTLLKEIIVHNIVQRAGLLADYEKPDDAFCECSFLHGEKRGNGYSDWYPKYYKLKNDKINDYGILVTSCNNTAVENITKELPLAGGITGAMAADAKDSQVFKEQLRDVRRLFDPEESACCEALYCKDKEKSGEYRDIYFTEYANGLLGNDSAWGLISAALGKRSNIHRFYQNVLRHLDADFYKNEKIDRRLEDYQRVRAQFLAQKQKVEQLRDELAVWCEREKELRKFCAESMRGFQARRRENEKAVKTLEEDGRKREVLEGRIREQEILAAEKGGELEAASRKLEAAREAMAQADQQYEETLRSAGRAKGDDSVLDKVRFLFSSKETKELAEKCAAKAKEQKAVLEQRRAECQELECVHEKILQKKEESEAGLRALEEERERLVREMDEIPGQMEARRHEIRQLEDGIEAAKKEYREALDGQLRGADDVSRFTAMDEPFMRAFLSEDEGESTGAQVANLWFTQAYNREREKLFSAAMQLNKAFVLSSKNCFRNYRNLALLWQETKEDNELVTFHPEDREACFGPLLQSLFLLVPVISTTFASVGSFLKDIKEPRMLGTLIVDEAGQAPPQMAVGAMYRCRKTVIVGDPKQVEPVVTDDLQLLKKAYREDVYKPYKSKQASVQQFADRINPYGTYMENEYNEREWVGCPLVVHRRCISPMYDISNHISYNDTMKQQTREPSAKKAEMFCYPGSRWINVAGKEAGKKNHFVEAQGKRVLEILELAFSKADEPSLFVITPFTTVKTGMVKCIENSLRQDHETVLYQKRNSVREWMYKNIGTVHTFQGKEAGEVIFLLGCDAGKESAGAIRWVNSNLVNVAVTRAKYRLYVVGDERAWKESVYISQAKSMIDLYALKELGNAVYGEAKGSEEERRDRALTYCRQLPPAESFSVDAEEGDNGEMEYEPGPEIYLNELRSGGLLLQSLTDEQLKGYGFSREAFEALNPQVREYIEWGIKIYSMLKKLIVQYKLTDIDTSCCGILFCKAAELQVKECFYEGVKKHFPDYRVKLAGGRQTPVKEVKKDKMLLGTFQNILGVESHRRMLAEHMGRTGEKRCDFAWWTRFHRNLDQCRELRNACCHCDKFVFNQVNRLLTVLFLRDKGDQEPVMDGVVRDSEMGRRL